MIKRVRRFIGLLLVLVPIMLVLGGYLWKLGLEESVRICVAFAASVLLSISVIVGLHLLATPNR